jgi:hypothetical protein
MHKLPTYHLTPILSQFAFLKWNLNEDYDNLKFILLSILHKFWGKIKKYYPKYISFPCTS